MKSLFLITCVIGMFVLSTDIVSGNNNIGLSTVVAGNTEGVFEHRTIVPYPVQESGWPTIPTPSPTPSIETMPYIYDALPYRNEERNIHLFPYFHIRPTPDGHGGFGTDFGIHFGIFRSHGLKFGIDFF